jgi:biopolymer transport protein ExbD
MRTTLLVVLFALSFARGALASGPPSVEIITTDAGIRYVLHKQGYGAIMEDKTPGEIEAWLREWIGKVGEREEIWLHASERTSFRSVMEMLRRFKAAGVKQFLLCTDPKGKVQSVLSGNFDNVQLGDFNTTPPAK